MKKIKNMQEIIITGFGGQGIVLTGRIVAKAAALGDSKQSTLVQSYGPEARGGACSAQVIISDDAIHYPYITTPDILVCMSQGAYDKFYPLLKETGTLIIDSDLVKPKKIKVHEVLSIPATRIAVELGKKMIANIIMVGFITSITGAISLKASINSVKSSVPKGTEQLNISAFNKGYEYGLALLKGREKKASGYREAGK